MFLGMFQTRKKLTSMDTQTLTKRIEECVIPDDREIILDYFEMMDEKMESEKDALVFKECKGVLIVMKILKKMITDAIIVRLGLTILDSARPYKEVIMDFIQFGGVDLLQKIQAEHDKELYLMVFVPQFMKDILAIGAAAAMVDITYEESNLLMCRNCQEVLERAKFKGILGLVDVKIPKTSDRVNRVVMFMENYTSRRDVQLLALDALMTYAKNCKSCRRKNVYPHTLCICFDCAYALIRLLLLQCLADCASSILDTEAIDNVGICVTTFIKDPAIVWRGCVVLWKVALFSGEICREVAMLGLHETLAVEFDTYKADPRVQQQVLWLFNSLLTFPKGRRVVHESEVSMALFKKLIAQRELAVGNLKNVPRTVSAALSVCCLSFCLSVCLSVGVVLTAVVVALSVGTTETFRGHCAPPDPRVRARDPWSSAGAAGPGGG
jgi:hypothetical protein